MKPHLVIFAKAPRMGLAKTRLAKGIGAVHAWRAKRAMDAFTCRVARSPAWHTLLAVAPHADISSDFPGAWPLTIARIGQGSGDLGKRMAKTMRALGRAPVCIIGSDLPGLKTIDIALAFRALKRKDAVFGPAKDGGYWLVGHNPRAARRARFEQVRWSSEHALADTLDSLPRAWRIGFLRELEDVDDAKSFKRLAQRHR